MISLKEMCFIDVSTKVKRVHVLKKTEVDKENTPSKVGHLMKVNSDIRETEEAVEAISGQGELQQGHFYKVVASLTR